jgi:hypothetical protein
MQKIAGRSGRGGALSDHANGNTPAAVKKELNKANLIR